MQYKCKMTVIDKKVFPDLQDEIKKLDGVFNVTFRVDKNFTEIFMDRNNEVSDEKIFDAVKSVGNFATRID